MASALWYGGLQWCCGKREKEMVILLIGEKREREREREREEFLFSAIICFFALDPALSPELGDLTLY